MKIYILIALTFASGICTHAHSQTLYQNNFSESNNPDWHRSTRGDNDFHETWSVTSSLATWDSNQYGRFEISITSEPSTSNVRWYGGFSGFLGDFTTLPEEWEMSFRVFTNAIEPIRIRFQTVESVWSPLPGDPDGSPPSQPSLTTWIFPTLVGWNDILLDHTTSFTDGANYGPSYKIGTYLRVSLASHDEFNNPLLISAMGDYAFGLDDITLIAVPEPSLHVLFILGAILLVLKSSRKRSIRGRCT